MNEEQLKNTLLLLIDLNTQNQAMIKTLLAKQKIDIVSDPEFDKNLKELREKVSRSLPF